MIYYGWIMTILILLIDMAMATSTSSMITLTQAGATYYNIKTLHQLADRVASRDNPMAVLPVSVIDNHHASHQDKMHCEIYLYAQFNWFLKGAMAHPGVMATYAILPLIANSEALLQQRLHRTIDYIFLCDAKGSVSLFPAGPKGRRDNFTLAKNASGELSVLTFSPNMMVLFVTA